MRGAALCLLSAAAFGLVDMTSLDDVLSVATRERNLSRHDFRSRSRTPDAAPLHR